MKRQVNFWAIFSQIGHELINSYRATFGLPLYTTIQKKQELAYQCDLAVNKQTTQTPCWLNDFFWSQGLWAFPSIHGELKMPFLLYLGKGTNPMKIFRVYLLSESQISGHLVKVNKHPVYLRNEGKGASFKLIVTTAGGETTILKR